VALLLAVVRGIVELDRKVRSGSWDYAAAGQLRRVADLRLGIVGFGRIGRGVARRARGLGIAVAAYDPHVPAEEMRAAGVAPLELAELLATSDALSVHAVLTPETEGLIGRRELAAMKRGSVLVNVTRAGIVDQDALLRALHDGHLGGAALDVLEVEPPTAAHPAPRAPNLIVTPHAAWYSPAAEREATVRAARSVAAVLAEAL
jgi:D-3-phosphoglycerate dehydrogenase